MQMLNQVAVVKQPKKILINVGTNEFDHGGNPTEIFTHAEETITHLRKSFPNTKIYVSSIFPRKTGSRHNDRIEEVNTMLETMCVITPKLTYMDNIQIKDFHLADEKHLNNKGLYLFLSNIRYHLFGQLNTSNSTRFNRGNRQGGR